MYPVAHIVVATGAARGFERAAHHLIRLRRAAAPSGPARAILEPRFDYRLVALGAWLPDIIDKPLGWWILDDHAYEHAFAHTLLFVAVLMIPGVMLAFAGDWRLFSLAFGDMMHVFCDPVMRTPETLFWPLFGWSFDNTLLYAIEVPFDVKMLEPVAAAFAAVILLGLLPRDGLRGLLQFGRL
jgi:LexA-binding, inner membrane-associated putative hydrolase